MVWRCYDCNKKWYNFQMPIYKHTISRLPVSGDTTEESIHWMCMMSPFSNVSKNSLQQFINTIPSQFLLLRDFNTLYLTWNTNGVFNIRGNWLKEINGSSYSIVQHGRPITLFLRFLDSMEIENFRQFTRSRPLFDIHIIFSLQI